MSLHYIIDGYNLIKRTSDLAEKKLESARNHLVGMLESAKARRTFRNEATIVFDGNSEITNVKHTGNIKVLFSSGENADAKIKRIVEESKRPGDIVVVTDDKEIVYYVRQYKADTISVQDFLCMVKRKSGANKPNPKNKSNSPEPKDLDSGTARIITEELTNIWLRKEK